MIRIVNEKDLIPLMNIRNQEEVRKYLRQVDFCTEEGQKKWFQSLQNDKSRFVFSILNNKIDEDVVGSCSILSIDYIRKHAEVGWFVDPKFHRKGFCYESVVEMLNFAFDVLELDTVYAYVYSDNDKGIGFVKKLQMNYVGSMRNRRTRKGKKINENIYDLTRGEFYDKLYKC